MAEIRANLEIICGHGFETSVIHRVQFEELGTARLEYERVADLMTRKALRQNDLPVSVEVKGSHEIVMVPLDGIRGVQLHDYEKSNENARDTARAFPFLFQPK